MHDAGLYVCFCPCLACCDISNSMDEYTWVMCCCCNVPQMRSKVRYFGTHPRMLQSSPVPFSLCFHVDVSNIRVYIGPGHKECNYCTVLYCLLNVAGLAVRRQLLLVSVHAVRRMPNALGAQEDWRHEGSRHLRRALPVPG